MKENNESKNPDNESTNNIDLIDIMGQNDFTLKINADISSDEINSRISKLVNVGR